MRPLGPERDRAWRRLGIMSGEAMRRSKSIMPPAISSTRSSAPAKSAPAALAAAMLSPEVSTAANSLAGALGEGDGGAELLVVVLGVDVETDVALGGLGELGGGVGEHELDSL